MDKKKAASAATCAAVAGYIAYNLFARRYRKGQLDAQRAGIAELPGLYEQTDIILDNYDPSNQEGLEVVRSALEYLIEVNSPVRTLGRVKELLDEKTEIEEIIDRLENNDGFS